MFCSTQIQATSKSDLFDSMVVLSFVTNEIVARLSFVIEKDIVT